MKNPYTDLLERAEGIINKKIKAKQKAHNGEIINHIDHEIHGAKLVTRAIRKEVELWENSH